MSGVVSSEPRGLGTHAGGDVLAELRAAARRVMERARSVALRPAGIEALAERLLQERPEPPGYDTRFHHRGTPASTLAFVVTLDTLNFGSGYFPHLRKLEGRSGYFTLAAALKRRFDEHGPWRAAELAEMTAAEMALVLDQDASHPRIAELLELYATALRDLGALLLERYGGRFEGLVEEAGGSLDAWLAALTRMPLFRDVAHYGGIEVPFLKRAQLAAADLALAFEGRGPGAFRDLQRLTAFADNLVPHVLRLEGALELDPELLARIEAGREILAGSEEEIEIRAAAVEGVERLVTALRDLGVPSTAHQLDQLLWHRGQRPEVKAHPRHRTRTVYY